MIKYIVNKFSTEWSYDYLYDDVYQINLYRCEDPHMDCECYALIDKDYNCNMCELEFVMKKSIKYMLCTWFDILSESAPYSTRAEIAG